MIIDQFKKKFKPKLRIIYLKKRFKNYNIKFSMLRYSEKAMKVKKKQEWTKEMIKPIFNYKSIVDMRFFHIFAHKNN